MDVTTVVLVHGAWADGSSWARVIEALRQRGQHALAVALPLTSLAEDVAAVERTIERTDGPVVLAGHAYGGVPVGAVRSERVKALAYVAAVAPEAGEAAAQAAYRGEPHPLAPKLEPDAHGLVWLPQNAFSTAFAPQAGEADQALLAAVQRPISVACISEPVGPPRWRDLPSWFLVADQDRMLSPDNQRLMAARIGARTLTHPVDHMPLASRPDLVADLIMAAVQA